MKEIQGKTALVFGLGKSGLAAIDVLRQQGADVAAYDEKQKKELGDALAALPSGVPFVQDPARVAFDLLINSPGVPWNHPLLIQSRRQGIPVWGELELAWRCIRPHKTVAITGTNGKTTTTALIGHILKEAGRPTVIGGNIGTPLCALINQIEENTFLVLEVSSYQLEGNDTFHPDVGVFLNLTADHLKRHGTMENYAKAKGRLFKNFTKDDTVVLNKNDKWCRLLGSKLKSKKKWFPDPRFKKIAEAIKLPGEHNLENAMAAVAAVQELGLKEMEIRRGLATFPGVAHRIQVVGEHQGVLYVNDSKSTNVDSTLVALKSMNRPTLLILGGQHKGSPYTPLVPYLKKTVKEILTIGESSRIISKDLKKTVPLTHCKTLDKAVHYASLMANRGDVVLLSPACASFDQFNNFEHRGDHFMRLVRSLGI